MRRVVIEKEILLDMVNVLLKQYYEQPIRNHG